MHRLFRRSSLLNMTEGRPLGLLFVFAVPLLIGNLFQQAYNLVDFMIVGRLLGANALAAVGATGSISFLFSPSATVSAAAAASSPPSITGRRIMTGSGGGTA